MDATTIQSIKSLIAKDEIHKAIKKLDEAAGILFPVSRIQLLMLNSRLNRLEKENHAGIISHEILTLHKNRINNDLIHLLNRLTNKRNNQYIHWVLWLIVIICGGLFFYGKTANTQGLKVEEPIVEATSIVYNIHKLEKDYNQYDLYFTVPKKAKELSLKPHIKLVKEDGQIVETKEILIGDVMLWKKSQGIKIHFPDRKGKFQLQIPIDTQSKNLTEFSIKNALTIKSNDTDARSGYDVFEWKHQLINSFWEWILKAGIISSLLISLGMRFILRI